MDKEKNRPRKHRSSISEEIKRTGNPLSYARSRKKLIIASKIANAIDQNGLKKTQLARLLNKDPSEVTRWTSGDHNFTMDTLSDLEEILGIQLISTQKYSRPKLQHAMECKLTVNIDTVIPHQISRQEMTKMVAWHIEQNGGMQVTEIKDITKLPE
jgi:ribosome-binding protein aMBF1 (putative translation factor)